MSKILITGINGFVGKHLARELKSRGHKVTGAGLSSAADSIKGLLSEYTACNLTDTEQVQKLPLVGVTAVISLAGLAQVGDSFRDPEKYKQINVDVLAVLGERILKEELPIRLLAVSSGAVYEAKQPLPLTEESQLSNTGSPYAQSKILMEKRAAELRLKGLDCLVVRPFNHIGPGQENGFLVPDIHSKIRKALESGEPIMVGNIDTRRDYTDVRDVVRAYADLVSIDEPKYYTYNVCSGRSVSGRQIVEQLLSALDAEDKIELKTDSALVRPDDPIDLYGSYEKLSADTGWRPLIDISQTIKDFVESKKQ